MPPRISRVGVEKREQLRHRKHVESERGWSGQHGQHPAGEEEKNYRPAQRSQNYTRRPGQSS